MNQPAQPTPPSAWKVIWDNNQDEIKKIVISALHELAQRSDNNIDDVLVELVAKALGIDLPSPAQAPAPKQP